MRKNSFTCAVLQLYAAASIDISLYQRFFGIRKIELYGYAEVTWQSSLYIKRK